MVKKHIYKIGLLAMLIVNVTLLFLMFSRSKPPMEGGKGLMGKISNKLNLDKEQETTFFKLAKKHRREMEKIEKEQKQLIKNYFNFLHTSEVNLNEKSRITEELKSLEAQKLEVTFQHFEELKSLCDDTQKAQFKTIINEIINVLTDEGKKFPPPPRGF